MIQLAFYMCVPCDKAFLLLPLLFFTSDFNLGVSLALSNDGHRLNSTLYGAFNFLSKGKG
jgi:hypothetical protein